MTFHLCHAAQQGHTKAYLRTVDSDVVVLTISFFQKWGLTELWTGFGHGKAYKDIPVHSVVQMLGPQYTKTLPVFHGMAGCDIASALYGIGKKTAWNAWKSFLQVTETFVAILQDPAFPKLDYQHMQHLERWVVLMYCKNSDGASLVEARRHFFIIKYKKKIPLAARPCKEDSRRNIEMVGQFNLVWEVSWHFFFERV